MGGDDAFQAVEPPRYGKDQPAFGRPFLEQLAADGYDTTPIAPPTAEPAAPQQQ